MRINFDDGQLQEVFSASLLAALDQSAQENLIQQALNHLVTQPESQSGFGRKPLSPLQKAYNNALEKFAAEEIAKRLKNNTELVARLDEAMADLEKLEYDDQKGIKEKFAKALVEQVFEARRGSY